MEVTSKQILRTYVTLTLLSTFASSFIWGINTLFLLSAGLSITQAFAANAFFTVGQVLFEIPTGVVADTIGRRASYLLGSATLFVSTLFYLYLWNIHGAFWLWALSSALLGLGFTFFSGATEAWLVDALHYTKYQKGLDHAFSRGQIAGGIAMLTGTVLGGVVAQATNLGVPYIMRAAALAITFVATFLLMKDVGFAPRKRVTVAKEMKRILKASFDHGLRKRPVRWVMLAAPFGAGVSFYAFYAMQPYLLELYGKTGSYAIAGLAAAIVAGAQIVGGLSVRWVRKLFKLRTSVLVFASVASSIALVAIGLATNFYVVLVLLVIWGIIFAASQPVRQAYLNGLIPSSERATVLSSDNLLASTGAVVVQPALGKAADVWSYGASYIIGGLVYLLAVPFLLMAKKEQPVSDPINYQMSSDALTEPAADPIAD